MSAENMGSPEPHVNQNNANDLRHAPQPEPPRYEVTFFADQKAFAKFPHAYTLAEIADAIRMKSAPDKKQLPWIKMATFGDRASLKGCLRTDKNIVSITGVEADYDGGPLSFADIVAKVRAAKITALIYTTPSDSPEKHSWRIICPLSVAVAPSERTAMMDRLHGLIGAAGVDGVSWNVSQSYFFGSIDGQPPVSVEVIEGDYLDNRTNIPSIPKPGRTGEQQAGGKWDVDGNTYSRGETSFTIEDGRVEVETPVKSWSYMLDAPGNVAEARRFLEGRPAMEPDGDGNDYIAMEFLRDFGLSIEKSVELAVEFGADEEHAREQAEHAWAYGQRAPGERTIEAKGPNPATLAEYIGTAVEAKAATYQPPPAAPARMTMRELVAYSKPVPEDLWHGLLPRGLVTMLYGDGGTGKTMLAMHLAIAVASGRGELFGRAVKQMPVVVVLCEDHYERAKVAVLRICEHLGITDPAALPIIWRCTPADPMVAIIDDKGRPEFRPFLRDLAEDVAGLGECLVILDTASDIAELNENLRLPVNTLLKKVLQPFCSTLGSTMLINAHPSSAQMQHGRAGSGTTAWRNAVRSRLVLKAMEELSDRRVLSNRHEDDGKSSYGNATLLNLSLSGTNFSITPAVHEMPKGTIDPLLLDLMVKYAISEAETQHEPVKRPRTSNPGNMGEPVRSGWVKQEFARQRGFTVTNSVLWEHLARAARDGYLEYRSKHETGGHGGAGYYRGERAMGEEDKPPMPWEK